MEVIFLLGKTCHRRKHSGEMTRCGYNFTQPTGPDRPISNI